MSREVLDETTIRKAFEEYKSGVDIEEVACKNAVEVRSLYRYFAKRGLKKHKAVKSSNKSVSDKQKNL